jgi:hypothetical protein
MSTPYIDTTGANSTTTTVVLGTNASASDNYYNNYSITIGSETQIIASYTGSTYTATLSSALSSAPQLGTPFIICNSSISVSTVGLIGGASTVSSVVLGKGTSATDGAYTSNYITIGTDTVKISGYTGATVTATLSSDLSVAPTIGEAYAICTTDPSAFLFGLNTSFIGGNRYFEIALVVCIIVVSICCVVSLLFLLGGSSKSDKTGSTGDGGPQQPINFYPTFSPIYYPPTYNRYN